MKIKTLYLKNVNTKKKQGLIIRNICKNINLNFFLIYETLLQDSIFVSVLSTITFVEPSIKCSQSQGSLSIPVQRLDDLNGFVNVSWQSRGIPGKPPSRYDGMNGNLVFANEEKEKSKLVKLFSEYLKTC